MPFEFKKTEIEGLLLIEPRVFPDGRGIFKETYKQSDFVKNGLSVVFKQDNFSRSAKGVLRGLHFQTGTSAQGKLVQVYSGAVWDVAVDLRPNSKTYAKWVGFELTADNHRMFWIPPGFAHGFVTLTDDVTFVYKCTEEYDKASESGIRWDDPDLKIEWPSKDVQVSEKDAILPFLRDLK